MKDKTEQNLERFEMMYRQYSPRVFVFFRSTTGDSQIAEDLLQATFLRIWENIDSVDMEKNVESYIFTIARNLLYSHFRSETYKKLFLLQLSDSRADDVEEGVIERDLRRKYMEELKQMPEKRRRIFLMSRIRGLTYREIANRLGISENTVDTQIRRALAVLRQSLKLLF